MRLKFRLAPILAALAAAQAQTPPPLAGPAGRQVPFAVRSSAPIGSKVTLDGVEASMDSTGRFLALVQTDSLRRADGTFELCLLIDGQNLCSPLRAQGFDTLDIAPLQVKVDTVVETRDTVRTILDTTQFDSTALKAVDGPKIVKSQAGQTVTVRGKKRPPRVLGQEKVTIQTIKRLPGLAEPDVIRAVQALPGVVQSSDFSTKIYVRGSSSDQNLILFDNAVIYSPNHFGGLFSSFLADATGGLDFYKGGFEPRYGNRLSSVLLVSSKNGGTDPDSGKPHDTWVDGTVRLTTFGGSASIEGHQNQFSWVYAGRRTWVGEALKAARDAGASDIPKIGYYFYDQQGSLVWGNQDDSVRVSIYQGRDSLTLSPLYADWGNLCVPVNVTKRFTPDLTYKGSASWSDFDQTFKFADIITGINGIKTASTRQELNWSGINGHKIGLGYEYNDFRSTFIQDVAIIGAHQEDNLETDLHAGFVQDKWTINKEWTVLGGLRANYYPETDNTSFDPRASVTWRPAPSWKAEAHAGLYHQYITSIRFSDQEMPNEYWYPIKGDIDPVSQGLFSVGVERSDLTDLGLRLTGEGFYKTLDDFLIYYPNKSSGEMQATSTSSDPGIFRDMVTGRGWAAGGEIGIAKDEGKFTGSLSYSLGWSVLKQDDFSNAYGTTKFDPTWTDWDQRQTFKLMATGNWLGNDASNSVWTWSKKGFYLRSTLQANFNTGLPLTDYDGFTPTHLPGQGINGADGTGQPVGVQGNIYTLKGFRNQARKPDYFRADLTLFDVGQTRRWRVFYTIINITDHENVFTVNYDTNENPPRRIDSYQFPFLPFFFGAEFEF